MEEDFKEGSSAIQDLTNSIRDLLSANQTAAEEARKRSEADKKAREDSEKARKTSQERTKTENDAKASLQKITSAGKAVATQFMSIADAGARLSSTLGISLTRGTQLELNNRLSLLGQLRRIEIDRMVTMQQIQAVEKSFVDVIGGARRGMELSAAGATEFASKLKKASGAEFTLTTSAMQAMITAGIGTAKGLETFKNATGLRSISEQRFAQLVNRNALSFMLYGPRFAKAAQEAEKLGISLAAVQSAQESMVTNLDGTLDTLNQVNQLGAQIDFGTLTRINEFEGPEATLKYLQSTIPPALFQSASTRALLKGFGISVEDLMKGQQSVQKSAADKIEEQLTKLEQPVGTIAKTMGLFNRVVESVKNSFGPLLLAIGTFAVSLFGIKSAFAALKNLPVLSKFDTGALSILGKIAPNATNALLPLTNFLKVGPLAGILSGITGFVSAKKAGADTTTAAATGATRGVSALIGAGLGAALLPFLGPLGPIIGAMLGDFFSRFIPKSIINTVSELFGSIASSFGKFVESIKGFFSAFSELISAISSENSKLAPLFKIIGGVLGAVVGTVITVVGGLVNILIKMATGLINVGAGALKLLARFISPETVPTKPTGDDVISRSGYGDRTLVTPNGSIALNNKDTVVAYADDMVSGIRTLSLGSIARQTQGSTDNTLVTKMNELISVLQNTKTTINIDNRTETVPRQALAGVYVRNQRV